MARKDIGVEEAGLKEFDLYIFVFYPTLAVRFK